MAQKPPKYPHMASCANPVIQSYLRNNYGSEHVCWPIVWLRGNHVQFYTFELTDYCDTNSASGRRPVSLSSKGCHFVSYIDTPRAIVPPEPLLIPSIASQYECSYDYVIRSDYATVDLDYVWERDDTWFALEVTTWWKPFFSQSEAERLIPTMSRRPSWASIHGGSAILKQIEAAGDLGISRFIMACVNTRGGVDNDLDVEGNAYWFDLSPAQVSRLLASRLPQNANYGSFAELLKDL